VKLAGSAKGMDLLFDTDKWEAEMEEKIWTQLAGETSFGKLSSLSFCSKVSILSY